MVGTGILYSDLASLDQSKVLWNTKYFSCAKYLQNGGNFEWHNSKFVIMWTFRFYCICFMDRKQITYYRYDLQASRNVWWKSEVYNSHDIQKQTLNELYYLVSAIFIFPFEKPFSPPHEDGFFYIILRSNTHTVRRKPCYVRLAKRAPSAYYQNIVSYNSDHLLSLQWGLFSLRTIPADNRSVTLLRFYTVTRIEE